MSKNMKALETCGRSPDPCNIVFIVPDTNIWFDRRKVLFKVLEHYKGLIAIALPHIVVDEGEIKKKGLLETYKRAVLREIDEEVATQQFMQKLLDSVLDAMTRGFLVTAAHTPLIIDVSRLEFSYFIDVYDEKILDSTLREYISKSKCHNKRGCYFSTLKQVIDLVHKLRKVREIGELKKVEDEINRGLCKYEHLATALKNVLRVIRNRQSMNSNERMNYGRLYVANLATPGSKLTYLITKGFKQYFYAHTLSIS